MIQREIGPILIQWVIMYKKNESACYTDDVYKNTHAPWPLKSQHSVIQLQDGGAGINVQLFKTQQQKLKSQLRLACDESDVTSVLSQLESQPLLVAFHWHQISLRRIQMLSVPHLSLMSRSLVLLGRAVCVGV